MDAPGERLIAKMWESLVDKGIGGILAPWQEKRLSRARIDLKREEMLIIAKAEQEIELMKSREVSAFLIDGPKVKSRRVEPTISDISITEIAKSVDISESVRKEINVARAIIVAEDDLVKENIDPIDKPIDEDWIYMWRDNAGRVSSEQLQTLWGQILAGEVKNPGTYSLRTLDFLRGITKEEADLITEVAKYVVGDTIYLVDTNFFKESGVTFTVFLALQDIGLLSGVGNKIGVTLQVEEGGGLDILDTLDGRAIHLSSQTRITPNQFVIYNLTKLGSEVFNIGEFKTDEDYINELAKCFKQRNYKVEISRKHRHPEGATIYSDYVEL
jgi:hypothetical protein